MRTPTRVYVLPQVAPVVEFVGVFRPAVPDVGAVVHVRDEDVFDSGVHLSLSLLHGLAGANYREYNSGCAGDQPLAIHLFYVFDVNLLGRAAFEDDSVIFRERFEGGLVVEREWRDDDTHADLKAAARAPLWLRARRQFPEEIADGREDAFLLDENCRIAKARSEFQRVDAVVVDDAVQVDVTNVAFKRELWLHLEKRAVEECVGFTPEHRGAHLPRWRADFAR